MYCFNNKHSKKLYQGIRESLINILCRCIFCRCAVGDCDGQNEVVDEVDERQPESKAEMYRWWSTDSKSSDTHLPRQPTMMHYYDPPYDLHFSMVTLYCVQNGLPMVVTVFCLNNFYIFDGFKSKIIEFYVFVLGYVELRHSHPNLTHTNLISPQSIHMVVCIVVILVSVVVLIN